MKSSDAVAWAAHGGGGSPSLEVIQNCGDVALRAVVSGHGGVCWWLDWVISEVFSHLYDSMIQFLTKSPPCFRPTGAPCREAAPCPAVSGAGGGAGRCAQREECLLHWLCR